MNGAVFLVSYILALTMLREDGSEAPLRDDSALALDAVRRADPQRLEVLQTLQSATLKELTDLAKEWATLEHDGEVSSSTLAVLRRCCPSSCPSRARYISLVTDAWNELFHRCEETYA